MYLENSKLFAKMDLLEDYLDENFGDDNILENEYPDIVHSIISSYLFEVKKQHIVNSKKIQCILKSHEKKVEY